MADRCIKCKQMHACPARSLCHAANHQTPHLLCTAIDDVVQNWRGWQECRMPAPNSMPHPSDQIRSSIRSDQIGTTEAFNHADTLTQLRSGTPWEAAGQLKRMYLPCQHSCCPAYRQTAAVSCNSIDRPAMMPSIRTSHYSIIPAPHAVTRPPRGHPAPPRTSPPPMQPCAPSHGSAPAAQTGRVGHQQQLRARTHTAAAHLGPGLLLLLAGPLAAP